MDYRNMFLGNPNNYTWNQGHPDWYRQRNHEMFMHQGNFHPGPPGIPFQNRMNDYNNYMMHNYPGPSWQGSGTSRSRGRSYRGGRGSGHRAVIHRNDSADIKDTCCQCGERLQNSEEPGIHLCSSSSSLDVEEPTEKSSNEGEANDVKEDDLDERLEKLLDNLKDCMRKKYQTVTEALEEYVSEKIGEITTLHKENTEQKETLEKLKTELEEKAASLMKEEKELRDKQRRLVKDQENFKKEMKKEKEEVCRRWQELKDEITRMEETHEIQKVKLTNYIFHLLSSMKQATERASTCSFNLIKAIL